MAAEMLEKTVTAIGKRYLEHAGKSAQAIARLRERVALLESQCTNWERVDREHRETIATLERGLGDARASLEKWSKHYEGEAARLDKELAEIERVDAHLSLPRIAVEKSAAAPAKPHHGKGNGVDLLGTKVGTFVVVEKTAERYFGQAVWLLRCPDCGSELRWYSQKVRRSQRAPLCKCSNVPEEAIGKRATGPRLPLGGAPNAVAAPSPARPAYPAPGCASVKRPPAMEITGERCGTFVVGERSPIRRGDGSFEWRVRCIECDARKNWSVRDFQRAKAAGQTCPCQKAPKAAVKPWSGKGRPPEHVRLQRERDLTEKPVEDLTADELEAETLAEFERDRSLPRLTSSDERRPPPSLLDDPEEDDDEPTEEDEELAAADERDRAAGDEYD